jgi:hypothetical protein
MSLVDDAWSSFLQHHVARLSYDPDNAQLHACAMMCTRPEILTYASRWEQKILLLGQAVLQQSLLRISADADDHHLLQCGYCWASLRTGAQLEAAYRGCASKATVEASFKNLIHAKDSKVAK